MELPEQVGDELAAAALGAVDFRTPASIRLGLSPLPTSFVEVWDALEKMLE
jgi:kynureninase